MTRRTDDLPEEWHKCYDEARWPRWLRWVFIAAAALLIGALFAAWFWGRV